MKRNLPLPFLCVVLSTALLSACAPGSRLVVPGEISRPPASGPPPAGPPRAGVAVADFSYTPPGEPQVIGRDYDQVRQVVWGGDPGKLLANLVAGALSEQGVPASRLQAGAPVPDNAATVVTGAVQRFDVSIRRRNIVSVYIEATVGMSMSVTGRDAPATWETSVTSSAVLQDVFPLPDDVRKALSSAANSAAEEGVRRLQERGAAGPPR